MRADLAALALLLAFPLAGSALAASRPAPLAPGDPMPPLEGRSLAGRPARFPEAALGRVALLALGFSYASRFPVEAWAKRFRAAYGADSTLALYEIPMYSGSARLARPFIDGGMRRSTPSEMHEFVVTTSGETGRWKPLVDFREPDDAYLLLLGRDGRVLWRHAGAPSDSAWRSLEHAMGSRDTP